MHCCAHGCIVCCQDLETRACRPYRRWIRLGLLWLRCQARTPRGLPTVLSPLQPMHPVYTASAVASDTAIELPAITPTIPAGSLARTAPAPGRIPAGHPPVATRLAIQYTKKASKRLAADKKLALTALARACDCRQKAHAQPRDARNLRCDYCLSDRLISLRHPEAWHRPSQPKREVQTADLVRPGAAGGPPIGSTQRSIAVRYVVGQGSASMMDRQGAAGAVLTTPAADAPPPWIVRCPFSIFASIVQMI